MSEITVFRAKRVYTMNPSQPIADAVAVRDGQIIEVGTVGTLQPWLDAHPHRFDDRFAQMYVLPGFIDPHLHPSMAAVLLPLHFVTAMEWRLPWATYAAVRGHNAYVDKLKQIDIELQDASEPLITWGYHSLWHGDVDRGTLDGISSARPIVVWQRSFHEIYANSAALAWLGITDAQMERHPQTDAKTGRFCESGLALIFSKLKSYLLEPTRFRRGLELVKRAVHFGGHTTIGDMAVGLFDLDSEWPQLVEALDSPHTPFRTQMVARGAPRGAAADAGEQGLEQAAALVERNTHRLRFSDHIKLFTDGGFFAELMQVQPPGFIDGHSGEWLTPPEVFEDLARTYWNAGYRIHVHCTGDLGLELALDVLEKLQWERPRFNHRFTIEHFGLSTPEQVRRLADLGGIISANVYYVYELADAYWKGSIGYERASQMARVGTAVRAGITTALHSDFTMAPALPLNHAWVAANRVTESGVVMGEHERLTVEQAIRAITLDAAYVLGIEDKVGSIRAGKSADFTVLLEDPFEVDAMVLRDIPIWGTVFEGDLYPL
ncbi:MAG: amidohydrolase [Gammaproteobacteria bacterium]|nr:amidohydrolase [Gammaproteobacteria bacterium]